MKESSDPVSEFLDALLTRPACVEWLRDQDVPSQCNITNGLWEVRFRWEEHFWSARYYPNGNFKELVWA